MIQITPWSIVLIAIFAQTRSEYASECPLPNQQTGHCLPVVSCKPLHDFFEQVRTGKARITPTYSEHFKKLHCGNVENVPHACCSKEDVQLNPTGLKILKNQECGVSINRKVSNGVEIALSGMPWMALLVYDDRHDPFKCGGTLISEQYVLTAAHCINEDLYQVRLGEHRLSTNPDCIQDVCAPPVENINITKMIIHPGYSYWTIGDDVALLRLSRKVQYQDHIKPICLPIYDNIRTKVYDKYTIAGWGKTENAKESDVLLGAVLPFVNLNECQQMLQLQKPLRDVSICAGNTNSIDGCRGDSGGPLATISYDYNGQKRAVQYGILSKGKDNCGSGNSPSIYMNVSHYLQWITDKMQE